MTRHSVIEFATRRASRQLPWMKMCTKMQNNHTKQPTSILITVVPPGQKELAPGVLHQVEVERVCRRDPYFYPHKSVSPSPAMVSTDPNRILCQIEQALMDFRLQMEATVSIGLIDQRRVCLLSSRSCSRLTSPSAGFVADYHV